MLSALLAVPRLAPDNKRYWPRRGVAVGPLQLAIACKAGWSLSRVAALRAVPCTVCALVALLRPHVPMCLPLMLCGAVRLQASAYAHQVGRTGRGGRPGRATTFVAPQDGRAAVWLRELLQGDVTEAGKPVAVPSWLERLARRHLQQQQQQPGAGQGNSESVGKVRGVVQGSASARFFLWRTLQGELDHARATVCVCASLAYHTLQVCHTCVTAARTPQAGGRRRHPVKDGRGGGRGRCQPRGVRELPDLDDAGAAAPPAAASAAAAPSEPPTFGTFLKPRPPRGAAAAAAGTSGLGSSLGSSLGSLLGSSLGSLSSVDAGDWAIGAASGAAARRSSVVGPEEPLSLAAGVGPRGRAGQAGRGAAERSAVADPGHDAAEWQARFEAALREGYRQGQEAVQQQLGQLGQGQGQGREQEQAAPPGAGKAPRRKAGRGPRRAADVSLPVVLEAGDVRLEAGGPGALTAGFTRS